MSRALPRYRHLKERILARIADGELTPGDRVPSENELVEAFGVSRMTANRALRELGVEGYVERRPGIGTFVADLRAASHVLEVRNIADEIAERGHRHASRVIALDDTRAGGELAGALEVEPGTPLFRALIVHAENDQPVQLEDRHVLASFAPAFAAQDFTRTTPSAYLSGVAPLTQADQIVRAEMPARETRERLEMPEGEPCLVVTRRTWANGRPVSHARLHHPGSRFELAGHYTPPNRRADRSRMNRR